MGGGRLASELSGWLEELEAGGSGGPQLGPSWGGEEALDRGTRSGYAVGMGSSRVQARVQARVHVVLGVEGRGRLERVAAVMKRTRSDAIRQLIDEAYERIERGEALGNNIPTTERT